MYLFAICMHTFLGEVFVRSLVIVLVELLVLLLLSFKSSSPPQQLRLSFIYLLFWLYKATPAAYGGSQARGLIGATAAGLRQSHSNTKSVLRLQAMPQLTAMLGP